KRCPTCLGSGEYPPAVGDPRTLGGYRRRWRDDDDDRDTWVARGYGAGAVAARIDDARDQGTQARDDAFEVGSGGRAGGRGATASWGDASEDKAPGIVDPFAGESSTGGRAIVAEAAHGLDSGSSGGHSPPHARQFP